MIFSIYIYNVIYISFLFIDHTYLLVSQYSKSYTKQCSYINCVLVPFNTHVNIMIHDKLKKNSSKSVKEGLYIQKLRFIINTFFISTNIHVKMYKFNHY